MNILSAITILILCVVVQCSYAQKHFSVRATDRARLKKEILADMQFILRDAKPQQIKSLHHHIPLCLAKKDGLERLFNDTIDLWELFIKETERSVGLAIRANTVINKIVDSLGKVLDKLSDPQLEAVFKVVHYVEGHHGDRPAFIWVLQQAFEECVYGV
ncbi:unnamed protein product [Adineta ricciae]|uniref:Uncharacterized protein n=1 Tax=Adineta ricciae TaxID=249248 RepID=A0A815EWD4_ADIRI|nr:unnamed protein product [Adineta ricciae]CAF1546679.1 unnamed protein product [Adineta ricciae]